MVVKYCLPNRYFSTVVGSSRRAAKHRMDISGLDQQAPADAVNVFVSYSRDDRKTVLPIIQALENSGLTVWWDGLLEAGTVFLQTTEQALEQADAVLVLWTKTSVNSNWVRDEATIGRDSGRLVPITTDGSMPPLGFRQFHVVDLSSSKNSPDAPEFQNVTQSIRALMGQPLTGHPPAPSPVPSPAKRQVITRRSALAAGGATLAAGAIWAWSSGWMTGGTAAAAASSIAVMPFSNLSEDASQDYFAAGLSEELRSTLSLNPQLLVAAKTSSNLLQEQQLDSKAIAQKLNVSHILVGSVRRSGNTVRISTQLVDGLTGFESWSESFDRTMTDIFAIQDEIATAVADALVAEISQSAQASGQLVGGTQNAEAYDNYLKGKALYDLTRDEKTYRSALAHFDDAIRLDSNYAAAYAARSRTLTVIANRLTTEDELAAYYDQAIAAARQATKLAPSLAVAQAALGFVLLNGRLDIKAASEPYQKSYELGFGNADILSTYAVFAARTSKFEDARIAIGRALKLDPLNSSTFRNAGIVEFAARDFDAAISYFEKSLSINPDSSALNFMLGDIAIMREQYDEAEKFFRAEPDEIFMQRGLAIIAQKRGQTEKAQEIMAAMIASTGDTSLLEQAEILAQWGDLDGATQALIKAYEDGNSGLVLMHNDPLLDPLRNDRRFKDLQLKLGFE